jgi:hypothetical protein
MTNDDLPDAAETRKAINKKRKGKKFYQTARYWTRKRHSQIRRRKSLSRYNWLAARQIAQANLEADDCNPHGYRILFLASFLTLIHSFINSLVQHSTVLYVRIILYRR